jgi:hypothetical protein
MRTILVLCTLFVLAATTLAAADVTGKWTAEVQGRNGPRTVTFTLKQDGSKLTGEMQGMGPEPAQISDGKVSGDNISFTVKREFNGNEMKINYTGKVEGDSLKMKSQREGGDRTQEFTAKKVSI